MIRYLIKFVSEYKYAQDLQSGKLFMHPASYYHYLELGQGDLREGAISHYNRIYKNSQFPIYCLYSVYDTDINDDGMIAVSESCINDFKCSNGYAVILDFKKFQSELHNLDTKGHSLCGDVVKYHIIQLEETKKFLLDDTVDNFFIKHP